MIVFHYRSWYRIRLKSQWGAYLDSTFGASQLIRFWHMAIKLVSIFCSWTGVTLTLTYLNSCIRHFICVFTYLFSPADLRLCFRKYKTSRTPPATAEFFAVKYLLTAAMFPTETVRRTAAHTSPEEREDFGPPPATVLMMTSSSHHHREPALCLLTL